MSGITNPAEPYFKDGAWGWDGSVWRKLPMVWGYSDRYAEVVQDTSLPAGVSNIVGTIVPAGEVWKVSGATILVVSGSCNQFRLMFYAGGVTIIIDSVLAPTSGQAYPFSCDVILKAGDYMYFRLYNMTLNDDAFCYFWGYKMKIAE